MTRSRCLICFTAPRSTWSTTWTDAISRSRYAAAHIVVTRTRDAVVLILSASLSSAYLDTSKIFTRAFDSRVVLSRTRDSWLCLRFGERTATHSVSWSWSHCTLVESVVTWAGTFDGASYIISIASTKACIFGLVSPIFSYIKVAWSRYRARVF